MEEGAERFQKPEVQEVCCKIVSSRNDRDLELKYLNGIVA